MQNKKSYVKPAFENYFNTLKKSLPFLGLFTLVVLAVWLFEFVLAMYGYSLGFLNVIIIGLVLVPLYFATQVCVYMIRRDNTDVPAEHFFNLFKLYFKPNFMGLYRIIRNLLLSMLWALAFSVAFAVIYNASAAALDPAFVTASDAIYSYIQSGDSEAALNYMSTSESYIRFLNILSFVSVTAEFGSFFFYMSRSSAVMYVSEAVTAPSPKFVIDTYKNAFRGRHVPNYNKEFFKGTWFIYLLFIIAYAGGSLLGFFIFEGNPLQWTLMGNVGLGFALILFPIVIPYFLLFLSNLIEGYKENFIESAVELLKFSYQEMKSRNMFGNEEEENKYKAAMKEYEDLVSNDPKKGGEDEGKKINKDDYGSSDHH